MMLKISSQFGKQWAFITSFATNVCLLSTGKFLSQNDV
uniref:Uncharacterized protein n=1 Tax=Medicago truncatula TaxID=3880 RepID=B7FG74_MEDTR|nr:unknown [Medicago truncatula]